jgi:potassium efflux system protein
MTPYGISRTTTAFVIALLLPIFLVFLGADPKIAHPANVSLAAEPANGGRDTDLSHSIERTLKVEEENSGRLIADLKQIQSLKETVDREMDAYRLQMSIHGSLLQLPTTPISDLEKARADQKVTLDTVAAHLKRLSEQLATVEQLRLQTEEKYSLNEKQLIEIRAERSKDPSAKTRLSQFEALTKLISSERKTIIEMLDVLTNRISQWQQTDQALRVLTDRFDQEISSRKKEDLFKRKERRLRNLDWQSVDQELSELSSQVSLLFTVSFWARQTRALWAAGGLTSVTFVLLFGILYFLFLRLRRYCLHLEQIPVLGSRPHTLFTFKLIRRSLPLLGVTVFLYAYAQARLIYSSVPFIRVVVYVLLVWLFCRWELDLLKALHKSEQSPASEALVSRLKFLIFLVRAFAIAYIILSWMMGQGGVILFLCRISFETVLVVWSVSFFKIFRQEFARFSFSKSRSFSIAGPAVTGLGYTITVGGLLLELAGYGNLALHWYASWGRTIVFLSWAALLFLTLQEWGAGLAKTLADAEENGTAETARPAKWFLVRLAWVAWLAALLVCLLLAWGEPRTVIVGLVKVVIRPIQIGSMSLSLLGFIYAALVLLFTHAAIRVWRRFLRKQILVDSGIELGLQESIATVTTYLFWALGILVGLNVMGLSTTSIAVAFGALSIGLGFGLQNIFNNFISGLILLFERPVQVGDVVQVNDVWGTVMKITVRSTVVQTFDNASLIIPNSDMISNQVTNWSFKDPRLRRTITVGVAYGSDIGLVRETLLEVARAHPKVLKIPRPDVLFADFADSALTFKLRFWSSIDDFLKAETDIRFEIDRLFRERKIEMPFPQRDIHLRSVPAGTQLAVNPGE